MKFRGMADFQLRCRCELVKTYNKMSDSAEAMNLPFIHLEDTFVVWACKTLQNYKALLSTTVSGDGVYVECTYNGDKEELYEDFYFKKSNRCVVDPDIDIV